MGLTQSWTILYRLDLDSLLPVMGRGMSKIDLPDNRAVTT